MVHADKPTRVPAGAELPYCSPSPSDWLPEKHLPFFISEVVHEMELGAFYARTFSSRRIAQKIEKDVAFRVLAAGNFPQHRTT
jgi:hypothetical protein